MKFTEVLKQLENKYNAWSVETWKKAIITVMETLPPGTALTREQIAALAVDFLLQTGVPKDAYDPSKENDTKNI